MLPEKLSNNLCSLRPNEDKLTFSAVFELDEQANIKSQWFGRTVIHSDRRFSYEQAQEILEGAEGDFKEELLLLNRLAYILRDARFKKGSIAFETPEVKFMLDERGTPLAVTPKIRKDAHKLIEDYMLLANKKVAEFVFNMRKGKNRNTMVYRVHEAPDPDRLKVFSAFAKKFGYRLDPEHEELATQFNSFITALENKPEQDILQNLAVRTMSKAKYTTEASGHFGLAFEHYSHFTSPIRRYPDVMAHRLLEHYLEGGESVEAEEWEKQCKHSSEQEKRAAEAERASIKYKQVQFMMLQETKVWDGIVSGVTEYGFYVEIVATKCEGMVRISDLQDDYYELDADNYRLIGTRTKRVIAFGDKVEVKVKNCNLEKRIIDLSLVDEDLEYYSTMKKGRGGYVPPQAAGLKKRGS
jgi:ribonuclease R